ncbi:hypothetical protein [Enterovibrio norvegicus]|uniref:hypothetical protein n=1 Tax=Enterovibrio norvegicus TaxID=188144 RepID=UPI000C82CA0D|nr:hypothetical protein [Enterovibrio norvegicus]PMN73672.1 hypothetical protein BCT27_01295 [Enterovibrio norvegicus]
MSFNFGVLLNQGKEAADLVTENRRQVREVFNKLNDALSEFLGLDITLAEEVEYEHHDSAMHLRVLVSLGERKKTGYDKILIKHEISGVEKKLMMIKRSADGYPITVVHEKNHYVADNQDEFAGAIGLVLSSSQTHLMFNSFRRLVREKGV